METPAGFITPCTAHEPRWQARCSCRGTAGRGAVDGLADAAAVSVSSFRRAAAIRHGCVGRSGGVRQRSRRIINATSSSSFGRRARRCGDHVRRGPANCWRSGGCQCAHPSHSRHSRRARRRRRRRCRRSSPISSTARRRTVGARRYDTRESPSPRGRHRHGRHRRRRRGTARIGQLHRDRSFDRRRHPDTDRVRQRHLIDRRRTRPPRGAPYGSCPGCRRSSQTAPSPSPESPTRTKVLPTCPPAPSLPTWFRPAPPSRSSSARPISRSRTANH